MEANTNTRELPVGIQDFEKLRTENYIYVDKTQYVYRMTEYGKPYFLARPRNFGKSLLLSTMKAYFEGKKELFEGLAIAKMEKEWTKYPVLHIDFSNLECLDAEGLNAALDLILSMYEKEWSVEKISDYPSARFIYLIAKMREKTGRRVAVLVDGYDKPLINTIGNPQAYEGIYQILRGFYGVLKSADGNLRFIFITGEAKFWELNYSSEMNQLQDISQNSNIAGICGITQAELEKEFEPEINFLAAKTGKTYSQTLDELRKLYGGYRFSTKEESVYNPFSLMSALANQDYRSYYSKTATSAFLAEGLREENFDIRKLEENDINLSASYPIAYRMEYKNFITLLYQMGYLTIKSYNRTLEFYELGFPNEEVKSGFMDELIS